MEAKTKLISMMIAIAIIIGGFVSCSNDSGNDLSSLNSESNITETEQTLIDYNNSLSCAPETRTSSSEWVGIVYKDAKGAYKGGKLGGRLGKFFGPNGAVAGTLVGAVVIGGLASYIQYHKYEQNNSTEMHQNPNLSPSNLHLSAFASAFAETKGNILDSDYVLGFYNGLDSCATKAGILHNKVLKRIEFHNALQDHTPYISTLSSMEQNVLNSDEFADEYNSIFEDGHLEIVDNSIDEADRIMALFINAARKTVNSSKDLNETIKFYTSTVSQSDTLSSLDKSSLLAAFSVMGYSYQYWMEKLAS